MKRLRVSIRTKILGVAAVALLPLLALQWTTLSSWQTAQEELTLRSLGSIARGTASDLQAYAAGLRRASQTLAPVAPQEVTSGSLRMLLRIRQAHLPLVYDLALTSAAGKVLVSTNPRWIGRSLADEPCFRQVARGADVSLGHLTRDLATGQACVKMACPVSVPKGRFAGALVFLLDPSHFNALSTLHLSPGDAFLITDSQGTLIYHSQLRSPSLQQRLRWRSHPLITRARRTGGAELPRYISLADGQPSMGVAVRVEPSGWMVAGTHQTGSGMAPVTEERQRSQLWLLITLALALAFAFYLATELTRPLRRLTQAASELQVGKLSVRVPPASEDELGDLARAFNEMASRIQRQVAELDDSLAATEEARDSERDARQTLETILESVPAAIWIAEDPECKRITGSQASCDLLRLPPGGNASLTAPEQERPKHFSVLIDGKEPPPEDLPVQQAARGEYVHGVEQSVVFHDGTVRHLYGNAAPLLDEDGLPRGAVAAFVDVTELKRAQMALEASHQREHYISELLQRAMMPEEPHVSPGWEVAAAYHPADSKLLIGGDFYDVFPTSKGRVGIVIGDVSGKGVEAAAMAASSRSTIRAFAYETSSSAEALRRANTVLYAQQARAASFVTALLVILNPNTGELDYCCAGHPPAVLRRADGEVELLESYNLPIGVLQEATYKYSQSRLMEADELVVYTDGLYEARNDQEEFGTEGIGRVLGRPENAVPESALVALLESARSWAGGKLLDDTAVIVLRRQPASEAADPPAD